MPSSIFEERADQFVENIGDDAIKSQIVRYLRQRKFAGPVVTVVGAKGRGKSGLFRKAAKVEPSLNAYVGFAGTDGWREPIGELGITSRGFRTADPQAIGDALICDAPAFGSAEDDEMISLLLSLTDFAVMAVQITQPAGAEERAFVQNHLVGIPSVLVLTKCDQTDEEDFQEGLEAVLENYGDFPWIAVLLSDLNGDVAEQATGGRKLVAFDHWWQSEGERHAEQARRRRLNRLRQNWQDQAREFFDEEEKRYAPQLEKLQSSRASSSSSAQAQRLEDELIGGLRTLPERALSLYKNRLPDLRLRVSRISNQMVDQVNAGGEIKEPQIQQTLSAIYQDWDQEARDYVRDEIRTTVERLHAVALRYENLIRAARAEEPMEMVKDAGRQETLSARSGSPEVTALQGDFDLTISDKLRVVATPTVSAIGAGLLLLNVVGATFFWPFAPIIAITAGGAMWAGLFGGMSQSNRRKIAGDLQRAIQRQKDEAEHELQHQFYSEWKQFSDNLRDSVAASQMRLSVLLMQQSPSKDLKMAEQDTSLRDRIQRIDGLRRDLHWLEEHNQDHAACRKHGEVTLERSSLHQFRQAKEKLALWMTSMASMPECLKVKTGLEDDSLTVQDWLLGLLRQVEADTFKVAVLGEYSSGKSSLLNVLLRLHTPDGRKTEGLLPTAVTATTAVITTLVYDEAQGIEVTLDDGRKLPVNPGQLNGFLTEQKLRRKKFWWSSNAEENEKIAEHIVQVKIGCLSPLLQEGVELVDTPGLGSINEKHARITKHYTAEIDAALFLVSVDPPMGEREMTFLQHIKTVTDRCLFVQTKRDLGEQTEHGEIVWQKREKEHRRRIEEVLNRRDYPFYNVCAYQAARGLRQHNNQEFEDSGFKALEAELQRFLVAERGVPRFEMWLKRSKYGLNLLTTSLDIERQELEAKLSDTAIVLASVEDYEQWKQVKLALIQAFSDNEGEADKQLKEVNKNCADEVMREARRELALTSGEQLAQNPDHRLQIERTLLRSIQYNSGVLLMPVLEFHVAEAQKALEQAFGEDLPKAFQQFLNVDFDWNTSQMSVDLSNVVETHTYVREENRGGFGIVDAFFGPKKIEVTEHNLDKDRFVATVEKAVEQTYREVKSEMQSTLKAIGRAARGEIDRLATAAKSAAEQQAKIQQQGISECRSQLEQNRQKASQLQKQAVELDQIASVLDGVRSASRDVRESEAQAA